MNSFCSFCASAGIQGPHDHFLRASKAQGANVVCPKLLATECNFCNKTGHTSRYCGLKREQEMEARRARSSARKIQINSGDWVTQSERTKAPSVMRPPVTENVAKFSGMFAALDMNDPDSSDDEDEIISYPVNLETENTWANVVKSAPKWDSDDEDELPPLIFGHKLTTRWGD